MDKETKELFDQTVLAISMVYQIEIQEIKEALFELQSFDKVILMCLISKEMGIPLWEVVREGSEIMNFHYEEAYKDVRQCWSNVVSH